MIKNADTRLILTVEWVLFFCVNLGLVIALQVNHWLRDANDFITALTAINNCYSPYVGVILVYYWNKKNDTAYPFNMAFYLAFILSIIWNGMITLLLAQLLMGDGDFDQNLALIKNIGGLFSWIVAGAIGLYFGREQ